MEWLQSFFILMPSLCHKFCLHEEFLLLYTIKKNSWATPKQFTNNEPKLN